MANEATLIIETCLPINMTCLNTTGVEKGTILKLIDPFTASGAYLQNDPVAGIAAAEKIANDGVTKIPVYRAGVFKVLLSGSCTAGDPLIIEGSVANRVVTWSPQKLLAADAGVSGAHVIGTALETGTNGETILMELNPFRVRFS